MFQITAFQIVPFYTLGLELQNVGKYVKEDGDERLAVREDLDRVLGLLVHELDDLEARDETLEDVFGQEVFWLGRGEDSFNRIGGGRSILATLAVLSVLGVLGRAVDRRRSSRQDKVSNVLLE